MLKISLFAILLGSLISTSALAKIFRCGDLLSPPHHENPEMQSAEIPFSVTLKGNYVEWISKNILTLFKTSQIKNYSYVSDFQFLGEMLKEAGLEQSPPKVVHISDNNYYVFIDFTKTNPKNKNEQYVVRSQFVVNTGSTSFVESLKVYNYQSEVLGFVKKGEDIKARSARVAAIYKEALDTFLSGGTSSWDPRRKSAWVSYLRTVLNELIVPIALFDPGIKEVGIGFGPNAVTSSDGRVNQMPGIIITRSTPIGYLAGTPTILLSPKHFPKIRIGGIKPSFEPLPPANKDAFLYFNLRRELVVFDEQQDISEAGSFMIINRESREARPVYFHQSSGRFSTHKPPPDDKPSNLFKLSLLLKNRVTQLEQNGYNPRVNVQIAYQDGSHEQRILSIRALKELVDSDNVTTVIEVPNRPFQ